MSISLVGMDQSGIIVILTKHKISISKCKLVLSYVYNWFYVGSII
jgi:hypothetical protein